MKQRNAANEGSPPGERALHRLRADAGEYQLPWERIHGDAATHAVHFERVTAPQIAEHEKTVQQVMQLYPRIDNGLIQDALLSAAELARLAERELRWESGELGSRDRAKIARWEKLLNEALRCGQRLEQWRLKRVGYRSIHAADRIVRRQFGDPGIPAADIVAARYGSAKAQLQVQDWVSGLVRNAALSRLNSRSRSPELLSVTTADIYAELVDGAPKWSREDAAREAGVAKPTYVNFRAAIFSPVSSALSLYLQRAALAARHVKMPRSKHSAPYRKVHGAYADQPASAHGFHAAHVGSGHDDNDDGAFSQPSDGITNLERRNLAGLTLWQARDGAADGENSE